MQVKCKKETHVQTIQVSSTEHGTHLDDLRPQLVCEVMDDQFGTVGYLVIDRSLGNAAIGGIRLAPNVTVDELAGLARAMTLKCAFLHTYIGGAKAGITAPASIIATNRHEVLAAFGRGLGPILRSGIYFPGEDIGISTADVNVIRQAAGLPPIDAPTDGAYYAALSVAETIKQSLRSRKSDVAGATVAIEGFGRVGSNIGILLAGEGARIMGVSTSEGAIYSSLGLDIRQLLSLMKIHGDQFVNEYREAEKIALADLMLLDVDVLVPCARPWAITANNSKQVRADMVIPGANISVTPQAERILYERDILYVPDFLTNGGAVLAASMVAQGFRHADIPGVMKREFAWKLAQLLEKAKARGAMPGEVAREVAWHNFRQMESELGDRERGITGLLKRALAKGPRASLERGPSIIYRHELLQAGFVRNLALADLQRRLVTDY